jgi:hypothetical protein
MFNDRPSKIIANFKSFLEVNFKPDENTEVLFRKEFSSIPMNIAITAAPIKWIGKRFSINVASTAISTAKIIPGISFKQLTKCFFTITLL